ncbi:UNVERIFIED_CONTAM: hypothetical protein GTU68_025766, partial [Idotea baltica]|nr:hypothetical protein [Idotea baltica]
SGSGFSGSSGGGFVSGGGSRTSGGFGGSFPIINILRDEREGPYNGAYSFLFETEDGTTRQESGSPVGPDGSVVQQGSWSFSFPDGSPGQFNFIADHNGYQVDSS